MTLRYSRQILAGLLAVIGGLAAPLVAEEILAHSLGMAGPPVFYGLLCFAAVATALPVWYSRSRSVNFILLYGVLSVGSALVMFVYLFSQTHA